MFGIDDALLGPIAGGLLGLFGGGDEPAGQTTTTQEPWGPQQGYLKDLFAKAQGVSGYGDQITQDQLDAQKEMGKWASGENFNPLLGVNNPYLTQVINNSSADAMRNLQPMINRANAASGSFGNSGVAETYGRTAADALGKIATQARMQDYTQQQNLYENDANRRISAIQPFLGQANYEQSMPWKNVQNYGQTIQGSYGGANSSPYFTNPAANVLGGAGMGSWLGNQINGGTKPMGTPGQYPPANIPPYDPTVGGW